MLFTIEPANIKKILSNFRKHDEIYINLTNVFDVIGQFSDCVGFEEITWLCVFTKYTKTYNKAIINVSELILTPFNPLDIKWKKLNSRNF